MVHLCDFCKTEDATVFCFADQAVLCPGCDQSKLCRIHSASKAVKKHERVSLLRDNDAATCDICQENKAIMFCSEDRALICRRCDIMIHNANEYVAKHHRYLLSGVAIGLKSLDGKAGSPDEADKGASKKPYSLRNANAAGSSETNNEDSWKGSNDRNAWRRGDTGVDKGNLNSKDGLSSSAREESQAALINMGGNSNGNMANAPSMPLTGASLMTPFGTNEEQAFRSDDSAQPRASDSGRLDGAGPSSEAWQGGDFGWGMGDMGRPDSSDFTLAAELLGLPTVSQGFTAKDIDAAYIFDDNCDLDASLSALLEVPSLDMAQLDHPSLRPTPNPQTNQGGSQLTVGTYGAPPPRARASLDGLVPDLQQQNNVNALKRQRLQD